MTQSAGSHPTVPPAGWWRPDASAPTRDPAAARRLLGDVRTAAVMVQAPDGPAVAVGGMSTLGGLQPPDALPLLAYLPPLPPESLGDPGFRAAHGVRFAYMAGAMANGIASADIVLAMAKAGMLGSFGAAGLSVDRVTAAIDRIQTEAAGPYCFNLIHSPNEPAHEAAVCDLYLRRGVKLVEASAYLDLTPAVVRYRLAGLTRGPDGRVAPRNRVIAKVSRVEVATRFLSPPPARLVQELIAAGQVTAEQAELAKAVPMCDDLTAEADSGGHTDNRPAITLLPTLLALRDRLQRQFNYPEPVRVGLAGGIATPAGVAAAFSMGAAYVVTGSVNQACVESGSSDPVRKMLAEAGQADVAMAPAADMFEMGVKVQVLKRGTMFAMRAAKLYELYRAYPSWEAVPAAERATVEKTLLKDSFENVWAGTREFWAKRDPTQLPKADADPKLRMALVFRWYLGLSSRWANAGDPARLLDYQVWCGPAMGAFNEWAKGSFLEQPANRDVVTVGRNLLYGACVHLRRQAAAQQGVSLPGDWFPSGPLTPDELERVAG
ncbi:MAG: PfaD family polyunsaturated fatty acid/polyketide biosynthesis protein [Gemmataceae bacterium]